MTFRAGGFITIASRQKRNNVPIKQCTAMDRTVAGQNGKQDFSDGPVPVMDSNPQTL